MPWKESVRVEERMKFIGRLLRGERMTELLPGIRYFKEDGI